MNDWLNGADGPLTLASWVCAWRWMQRPGVSGWSFNMFSAEPPFPDGVWQVTLCLALSFYCSHTCFSTNAPFICVHSDLTKQTCQCLHLHDPCSFLKNMFIYHLPALDFHVCMNSLVKPLQYFSLHYSTVAFYSLFSQMKDEVQLL